MNAIKIHVSIAELQVTPSPNVLSCLGLGSCVGLVLYEKKSKVGGLAHIVLPACRDCNNNRPAKFANTAVEALLLEMRAQGASRSFIQAKIFGGASMFPQVNTRGKLSIGESNVLAVLKELKKYKIPVSTKDVGGHLGRSIVLDTQQGRVLMRTRDKMSDKIFNF